MGICSKALKKEGYYKESEEMLNRITSSGSYEEALSIMMEYIEPVDQYGYNLNDSDEYDYDDINI